MATLGGIGHVPVAPGTVASAVTALVLWVAPLSRPALLLFALVVTAAGTWAAHHAERALGRKDPGAIVIDEVAGMTFSVLLLPLPLTPLVLLYQGWTYWVFRKRISATHIPESIGLTFEQSEAK